MCQIPCWPACGLHLGGLWAGLTALGHHLEVLNHFFWQGAGIDIWHPALQLVCGWSWSRSVRGPRWFPRLTLVLISRGLSHVKEKQIVGGQSGRWAHPGLGGSAGHSALPGSWEPWPEHLLWAVRQVLLHARLCCSKPHVLSGHCRRLNAVCARLCASCPVCSRQKPRSRSGTWVIAGPRQAPCPSAWRLFQVKGTASDLTCLSDSVFKGGTAKGPRRSGWTSACREHPAWSGPRSGRRPGAWKAPRRASGRPPRRQRKTRRTCW